MTTEAAKQRAARMTDDEIAQLIMDRDNLKLQVAVLKNEGTTAPDALLADIEEWRVKTADFMEHLRHTLRLRLHNQRRELRRLNRRQSDLLHAPRLGQLLLAIGAKPAEKPKPQRRLHAETIDATVAVPQDPTA